MIRVVLCTHNGVQFVKAQLASIMNQEHPVDIVHLFDFASTDGTLELVDDLASRWPMLDVRRVDHAPGVTLSFFHAFAQLLPDCGDDDAIFLSDQDDVWLPQKTKIMLECLSAERTLGHDRILAFHDVQICDEVLHPFRQSFYEGRPFRLPRDLSRESLLIANPVIGHTIVLTKPLLALALSCLRPRFYVMHDWALVLLAAHAGTIAYVPQQLGMYRQHDANILGAARKRSLTYYIMRAFELSKCIRIQTLTFIEDFQHAVRNAKIIDPPSVLSGRGSLAWRLGAVMIRRGPTIWHKLIAVLMVQHLGSRAELRRP